MVADSPDSFESTADDGSTRSMVDRLPPARAHLANWKRKLVVARAQAWYFGPAILFVAIGILLSSAARSVVDPTTIFLVAVAAATWSRDWKVGLVGATLATLAMDYFFIPPLYSIEMGPEELPRLIVFAVCAVAVNWASDARRVAAERARRDSERQLAALFEDAPIGIALIDSAGHAFKANPSLQKMLGYSEAELSRVPFTKVIHPPGVEADWNILTELANAKHHSYQLEKRCVARDGSMFWARVTFSLVRAEGGDPQFVIALVTER